MRVLLVHNTYRVRGGEESHVAALEAALRSRGHDVGRFGAASSDAASITRRASVAASMTYSIASHRRMRDHIAEWQPDVAHVHNFTPLLTPSVMHAAHRAGVPVVMTVHNHRLFCPSGTLTRRGRVHSDCVRGSSLLCGVRKARGTWFESLAYGVSIEIQRRLRLVDRWVDVYIAPSEYIASMLERAGFGRGRVQIIPHGVEGRQWTPGPREYALVAGRLSPEKGVATVLAAAQLAPDVPIVFAGDGPLAPMVEHASGSVTFRGVLSREQITEAQQRAAFSIVASECPEVFPLSAVESLASGTPVLATGIGGLTEIVASDSDGILVAPGDAQSLALGMSTLWERARTEPQYGRSVRERAATRFSLDTQLDRTLAAYGAG